MGRDLMPLSTKCMRRCRRPIVRRSFVGMRSGYGTSDGLKLESEEGAAACGLAGFADDHAGSVDSRFQSRGGARRRPASINQCNDMVIWRHFR